jgi:hypothetical protein
VNLIAMKLLVILAREAEALLDNDQGAFAPAGEIKKLREQLEQEIKESEK